MKKIMLMLLCALAAASSCRAQNEVVDLSDIIGLMDYKSSIAAGQDEEHEAALLMARAEEAFAGKGFTRGLTGDGYGGPCVIIDGFYKGGTVNKEVCAFEPGSDAAGACVVEMSACNDGDRGPYQLCISVELFSELAAGRLVQQIKQSGFVAENDSPTAGRCSYVDKRYAIDYSHETGYANDCHYFVIQTRERKAGIENGSDRDVLDYQEQ